MKQFQGTESGFFVAVFKCANRFQTVPDILVYGFDAPELSAEWLREQVCGNFLSIVRPDIGRDAYLCCNDNAIIDGLGVNVYASWIYSNGNYGVCGNCVLGCDFDALHPISEPDIFAAPAEWLRSYLDRLGLLSRVYLVE